MKKIELLAPAGDLEKLKIAILYGADAVFIGGNEFSLRARASNFTIEDIKEACLFAHKRNAKVYVTTNIIPHNDNLDNLVHYLQELEKVEVDAIIVASLHILKTAKKHTNLEVHISTQTSTINYKAVEFYRRMGAKRVVLGRELSIEEIKELKKMTQMDIEVFIHGGLCVSYSGRCMLSNNMTNRDANRGGCAHSCRWNYDLYGKEILNINQTPFSMSSKDLQSIYQIPRLIDAKVDSFKIEGRMKSIYYIAMVVKTYRKLIDDYLKYGEIHDFTPYIEEIKKSENRLTSHGFLEGVITPNEQLYNTRSEVPTKEFVGIVLAFDKINQIATIEQRNFFTIGDEIEVFGPNYSKNIVIKEIYDEKMNPLDAARHPQQIIKLNIDFPVEQNDMLRLINHSMRN